MNGAPRLERDAVLAALTAADVLARFGVAGTTRGHEFRTRLCPSCGQRARDSVVINLSTGRWHDKAHGCSGDVLALVAGLAALDVKRDFQRVLELAADIAGVGPETDPQQVAAARERRRRDEQRMEQQRQQERTFAMRRAADLWRTAAARNHHAEQYLRGRGLDPVQLIARGAVRFDYGDPIVALHSSRGEVINVVRRKVNPADGPKVIGMKGAPTAGTLVGRIDRHVPGQGIIITEGVADTLAAALAWPGGLVLGAHGASNLPIVAKAVARTIGQRGPTRIVAHRDPGRDQGRPGVGQEAAAEARAALTAAGISAWYVHDVAPHKDLAEAWQAGWRP